MISFTEFYLDNEQDFSQRFMSLNCYRVTTGMVGLRRHIEKNCGNVIRFKQVIKKPEHYTTDRRVCVHLNDVPDITSLDECRRKLTMRQWKRRKNAFLKSPLKNA